MKTIGKYLASFAMLFVLAIGCGVIEANAQTCEFTETVLKGRVTKESGSGVSRARIEIRLGIDYSLVAVATTSSFGYWQVAVDPCTDYQVQGLEGRSGYTIFTVPGSAPGTTYSGVQTHQERALNLDFIATN